ncbi:MAG: glutamyl-tRNA reductase [Chloroflexi bacterium]|nr:glutamyl-tRNA reductase [Chloroflexota bacterium]
MRLSLTGINHNTAPIALREKAAAGSEQLPAYLQALSAFVPHGVVLSTCNRTEIYTADAGGDDAETGCLEFLKARLGIDGDELCRHLYVRRDREVAGHLFRVACGLESMIIGEHEVLGQVGQSLAVAEKRGMVNLPLLHLFQSAVRAGRQVRRETGISRNALSISSVAIDLAAKKVGRLDACRLLVIGAGEAGALAARVARERGVKQIVIASRTRERASALASELDGTPVDLSELPARISEADIVVTCAGAPHRLVSPAQIETAMKGRAGRPLVIIDIALPRNVTPEVGRLDSVFLYNIDDLTGVSSLNRRQRAEAVHLVEEIIGREVEKFVAWQHDYELRPVLGALMSKAESIRHAQLEKTLKKLPPLSDEQRENLEAMTKSIVTRILKDPVEYLKNHSNSGHPEMVSELFRLNTRK